MEDTIVKKTNKEKTKKANGSLKLLLLKGNNKRIIINKNSVVLIFIFPNLKKTLKGIMNAKNRTKSKYDLEKK